jgi:hypothetical protein
MKKLILLNYALLFLGITSEMAQNIPAAVGPNINLTPYSTYDNSEVSIAINKSNPENIIVSANTLGGNGQFSCSSYDAFSTWWGNNTFFNTNIVGGDPSTAIDANGNEYIADVSV